MSDTIQVVQWALEQSCRLRAGAAANDLDAAAEAVQQAHYYAQTLGAAKTPGRPLSIFGDIHVTSRTMPTLPPRLNKGVSDIDRILRTNKAAGAPNYYYPNHGYVISERFANMGGAGGLVAICEKCPANASRPMPAGCVGTLYRHPYSEETEQDLEWLVNRLGLQQSVAEHFIATTPTWFGLWAASPLSAAAAGVLAKLFESLVEANDNRRDDPGTASWYDATCRFIAAARIAESGATRLHMRMTPPGHVDFGLHTIFPHCPRCKAEADVERWEGKYPTALCLCKVCGEQYSPAEHAGHTNRDYESDPDLRQLLGQDRFRAFARTYLVGQGMSDADAVETVDRSEAQEVRRQEIVTRNVREAEARQRYIGESLYAGLQLETLSADADSSRGFRAGEFEKLIRRCAERNIEITRMVHYSTSESMCRATPLFPDAADGPLDPLKTLRIWQSEGCNELFEGYFRIPPR